MLSQLCKKVGAILAASVAFFVFAQPASAVTAVEFVVKKQLDDVVFDKSLKPFKPYLKPKTAGTAVALFRESKGTPVGLAVAAVGYGASVYFEDEINQSLFELFLGDEEPFGGIAPEGTTGGVPDDFDSTKFWTTSHIYTQHAYPTRKEACLASTAWGYYVWNGSSCLGYASQGGQYYGTVGLTSYACGHSWSGSASWCSTGQYPNASPEIWPEDGVAMASVVGGAIMFYGSDTESFPGVDQPMYFPTPEGIGSLEVHRGNIARIREFIQSKDADGNDQTEIETIDIDSTTGQVVGVSKVVKSGTISDSAQPQTVSVQMPEGLATEDTLAGIKDLLANDVQPDQPTWQPITDKWNEINNSLTSTTDQLGALPSLGLPTFGGAQCTGIAFDVDVGVFQMHALFDKHCEFAANIINPILEWIFGLMAALYCFHVYREETTKGF